MSIGVRRNSKRFRDRSRGSDDRVRRCIAEHLERRTLFAAVVNAPGFSANSLPANDDGSTSTAIPLGFNINFFGSSFSSAFVNNNGNITFGNSLSTFTPSDLTSTAQKIIAPFWADVDTRAGAVVTYGTDTVGGHAAFGVEWNGVGYYGSHIDKLNKFELILIDRSDTGAGNFDMEFNYDQIQWETGDASGGSGGLGGTSARVGFSNGTGTAGTFFELSGSAIVGSFLDGGPLSLAGSTLNSASTPGRYVFNARNGAVTAGDNPFAALSAATLTTAQQTYTFVVSYAGISGIQVSSLDNNDLLVTGPNNFSVPATFVSVDQNTDGTPRAATYSVTAPSGNIADGTYVVSMQANQVSDVAAHFAQSGPIGTFRVAVSGVAPVTLSAPSSYLVGTSNYYFDVTYFNSSNVRLATIDNHDIVVTNTALGFTQTARRVSVSAVANLQTITATYMIIAPHRSWVATDAGTYTFTLNANQVTNAARPPVAFAGSTIGSANLSPLGGLTSAPAGEIPSAESTAEVADTSGRTFIAFFDSLSQDLKMMVRLGNGRFSPIRVVDPSPGAGKQLAITLVGGMPVIAYYDSTVKALKVARPINGVWRIITVDNSSTDIGQNPSITADASRHVAISYYDATNGDLRLAVQSTGMTFTTSTIDSAGDVGKRSRIGLNPATGKLAIAYTDTTNAVLKLATSDSAGAFTSAVIPGTTDTAQNVSVAFDSTGNAFVGFSNPAAAGGPAVDVLELNDGTWSTAEHFALSGSGAVGASIQLLFPTGATLPAVAFVDTGSDDLILGQHDATAGDMTTTLFNDAGPIAAASAGARNRVNVVTQPSSGGYALLLLHDTSTPVTPPSNFTNVAIPATAEISAAGATSVPDPAGVLPIEFNLPANMFVMNATSVTGTISLDTVNGSNNADGAVVTGAYGLPGTGQSTMTAFGAISGMVAEGAGELVGVFVGPTAPTGTPPPTLAFLNADKAFTGLSPLLNQVFFIGDGKTGTGSGALQNFTIPEGATRLFLGIPDAFAFNGAPGAYGDNSGTYTVSLAFSV